MKNAISGFDISIRVKPELQWIRPVELAARAYLEARAYPPTLTEQTISALNEAAEQLISLCVERDIAEPFEVGFAWQDEAMQVHLVYDASVPLNPQQEPNYEVPSAGADEGGLLAGLWLHIIKRTMDRVFFRIDGNRAALIMVKYYRAEQQARRAWVMGLAPKLRADLMIEQLPAEGQVRPGCAILHDTRGRTVLKLSASDVFIVSRFSGLNTVEDIYLEHSAEVGPVSPLHVQRIYETLEAAGMLETRAGDARGSSRWRRWLSPSFSIPRPDAAVEWVHRHARFIFNPAGVAVLLLAGFSGLFSLLANRSAVAALFPRIDVLLLHYPFLPALAYLALLAFAALHEFAHGAVCKHFGGRVRKLGIMWYMAMFIFYCDTTSAWTFPKRSQRVWVSLAGPLVSWAIFGVTACCAGFTASAATPWSAFWLALTLLNALGLVMNFNPLIRMDSYYILADWTDIPNLQQKAFDYLRAAVLPRAKGRPAAGPGPSAREKRIFLTYGLLSALMSFFFILLPFWQLAALWVNRRGFTVWGVIAFIVVTLVLSKMISDAYALFYSSRHREYKLL